MPEISGIGKSGAENVSGRFLCLHGQGADMLTANPKIPEQKRVTITSQRRITIPEKFFREPGCPRKAICAMKEGMLIIQPEPDVSDGGECAAQILSELISEVSPVRIFLMNSGEGRLKSVPPSRRCWRLPGPLLRDPALTKPMRTFSGDKRAWLNSEFCPCPQRQRCAQSF